MKITLLQSITRSEPVLDENDEPVRAKVRMHNREQETILHDHIFCPANTVIDVDDDEAESHIEKGYARKYIDELDSALPGAQDEDESDGEGDGGDPLPTETGQRRNTRPVARGKNKTGRSRKDPALD